MFDKLCARLGADNVFMDVDAIQPGQDFARVIEERLARCDVVVVLIGREWLTCTDANGRRRLDDPEDFVRQEIIAGLTRSLAVVPVLVEGAVMPSAADLPAALAALAGRQALTLSDVRFEADSAVLLEVVEGYLATPLAPTISGTSGRRRWAGIGAALFGTGLLVGLLWVRGPLRNENTPVVVAQVAPVSGRWQAEVPSSGGGTYVLRLQLETIDEEILRRVEFPAGSGGVKEGRVDGDRVSFKTQHRPQFEDREVTTRFEGRLAGEVLELVMQYDDVVQRIRARRIR